MRKSIMSRRISVIALALAVFVLMCGSTCAIFADTAVTKDETVYVITDQSGSVEDVIVSDHLVNDGKEKVIRDESDLKNIENVKGDEKFVRKGNKLEWSADGNDIFYQGKSDKKLPVEMSVSYYMAGEEFTGEEMQGQKGDFTIKMKFKNTNSVPFVILSGIMVEDEHYSKIEVNNGKVLDDGDKTIVLGLASSGLTDKLSHKLSDEIAKAGLGSEIIISGHTDSFDVTDIMTLATSSVFADIDTSDLPELDYDDQIKELDNGAKALKDGSKDLYKGLNTLNEKAPALADGVRRLNDGASKLSAGTKKLKEGADTLTAGQKAVADGVKQVYAGIKGDGTKENPGLNASLQTVSDGVTKLSGGVSTLVDNSNAALNGADGAIDTVITSLTGLKEGGAIDEDTYNALIGALAGAKKGIGTAKAINSSAPSESLPTGGIKETVSGTSGALVSGINQMQAGVSKLAGAFEGDGTAKNPGLISGANSITGGLSQLSSQVGDVKDSGTLSNGASQLALGLSEMNSQTGSLIDGIKRLADGSVTLSDGMSRLYCEGIKALVDLYNDDLKGLTGGITETIDAGSNYKSFSKLANGMDGSVKFIFKTSVSKTGNKN